MSYTHAYQSSQNQSRNYWVEEDRSAPKSVGYCNFVTSEKPDTYATFPKQYRAYGDDVDHHNYHTNEENKQQTLRGKEEYSFHSSPNKYSDHGFMNNGSLKESSDQHMKEEYMHMTNPGFNAYGNKHNDHGYNTGARKGGKQITYHQQPQQLYPKPKIYKTEVHHQDNYVMVPNRDCGDHFEAKDGFMMYGKAEGGRPHHYKHEFDEYGTHDKMFGKVEAGRPHHYKQSEGNTYLSKHEFDDHGTHDKIYNPISQNAKAMVRSQVVLRKHGPWGGNGGTLFDDGVYAGVREIHLARAKVIVSIKACYVDKNGQTIWGNKNGGIVGLKTEKVTLNYPYEHLTHISGYYGSMMIGDATVVKSITFHTNKQKYGPFGEEQGIPFSSFYSKDGIVVGFHGRQGWFLDSIGVHVSENKSSTPKTSYDVYNMTSMKLNCEQINMMKGPRQYDN